MSGDEKILIMELGSMALTLPVLRLDPAFAVLNRADLFVVTWLTLLAPVLCLMIDMWRTPLRLFRFLCQSTALCGALGPLSSLGVFVFAITARRSSTSPRTAVPTAPGPQRQRVPG